MTTYDRDYGRPISLEEAEEVLRHAQYADAGPSGSNLVSASVAAMRAYPPARPWWTVAEDLGIPRDDVLLLAANENALGPSPKAVLAAKDALSKSNLYPDGGTNNLKSALAERLDVSRERLVVGNGSNEIIELLVRTFVLDGETVVTAWPSFVVYRLVAQAHSRDAIVAPLRNDRYDLNALAALIDHRTKIVFIANPNNPTGTYVNTRELSAFLERIPRSVIVVLDEAYIEFTDAADFPNGLVDLSGRGRLVVLRTFSKMYGLAGLRVGYGVMDPELVDYIERVRQPYNVNAVAQAAAVAALSDTDHVERTRQMVAAGKTQLGAGLDALGLNHLPSQTNFLIVKLPIDGVQAQTALRDQGVLVRAMGGYSLPNSIRVTVATEPMNTRFLEALARVVAP